MEQQRQAADTAAHEQTLILVDDSGQELGYAPRSACHRGDGLRHAAIAVVLYNAAGEVLLQQRRSALWDGVWDITGATHPLHLPSGDESYEEATRRCLRAEWHVDPPVRHLLTFLYFERDGESAENEYCALYAGRFDAPIAPDPEYAYGMRWVPVETALAELRHEPRRFTPWARISLERLAAEAPGFAAG